jgi:hypothetical protein
MRPTIAVVRRLLALGFALVLACEPLPVDGVPEGHASPSRDDVRADRIVELLAELDAIAEDNGGTRYAGSPGYEASADWVARRMQEAGWDVTRHTFETPIVHPRPGSKVVVGSGRFADGRDLRVLLYSPPGRAAGPLYPVAFEPDVEGRTGPACDDAALAQVPRGAVVLFRPGPCFTRDQVVNASEAGAAAVLVAYPEFHTGAVLRPTLLSPRGIDIPALAVSDEAGEELASRSAGKRVEVVARTRVETTLVDSVIAESEGPAAEVVMAGGHLDSVVDGPGINDNGSGVATLIAIAEELGPSATDMKLRFAFWAGEELGLLGSTAYVSQLGDRELGEVRAYLNFDMLASRNSVRWIYDEVGAPEGSDDIAALFESYFDARDLTSRALALGGASDHGPFLRAGIPIGGIYTGSDEIKTRYLERVFRGDAGEPLDPCYHRACDDLDNINRAALEEMAGAAAHAITQLAELG